MINIIKGNLFDSTTCLVHCVSRDLSMSAGIAVAFSNVFGRKDELKRQNVNVGEVAWLQHEQRYIYNLVTKEKYWDKPTYSNIRKSIKYLFTLRVEHNVTTLSMPKIGCGLDKLQWRKVEQIIIEEWPNIVDFGLIVYYL